MELLFRKYFWAVNLLFLLGAAYFGAKTVNAFVAGALAPVPQYAAPAPPSPALSQAKPKTALTPESVSALTGIELPKPPPEPAPGTPGAPGGPAAPQHPPLEEQEAAKSGLRVRLLGTLVANVPEWSMASVEDVTTHETGVYMVGDRLQTAEVIAIERLRVIINNQGRKEYIDQEPGDGSAPVTAAAAAPVAPTPQPPQSDAGSGIRAVGDNQYEIPKTEIDKALGNLNNIAMQARIVPAFKDGVATGFKLFSIRPDSIYAKLGIQNGDVVRRINGYDINSPDKALEIYTKLKDQASRVEIELERNGVVQRKTVNVTP